MNDAQFDQRAVKPAKTTKELFTQARQYTKQQTDKITRLEGKVTRLEAALERIAALPGSVDPTYAREIARAALGR